MNCAKLPIAGGGFAIVCGRRKFVKACRACGIQALLLCDWIIDPVSKSTCDAPICTAHAFQVEPDKHLCHAHREAYRLWLRDQSIAY